MQKMSLKDEVMSYKNDALVARYAYEKGLNKETSQEHFRAMKAFLYLCGTSDQPFTPSEAVDDMWHTFLLFTRDYDDFCQRFFGKKVHHCPDVVISEDSKKKNQTQYKNMYTEAEKTFGTLSTELFPKPSAVAGCGDCGHGTACSGSTNCQGEGDSQ